MSSGTHLRPRPIHPHLPLSSDLPPAPSAPPSPPDPLPTALLTPQAETLPPPVPRPTAHPLSPLHAARPDRPHASSAIRPSSLGPDRVPLPALRPSVRPNPQDPSQDAVCKGCKRQTSVTAGTLLAHTKVPLRCWFEHATHLDAGPQPLPHDKRSRSRARDLGERDVAVDAQGVSARRSDTAPGDAEQQLAGAVPDPSPSSSSVSRSLWRASDGSCVVAELA